MKAREPTFNADTLGFGFILDFTPASGCTLLLKSIILAWFGIAAAALALRSSLICRMVSFGSASCEPSMRCTSPATLPFTVSCNFDN